MILTFDNWEELMHSDYAIVRKFCNNFRDSEFLSCISGINAFIADFNLKHHGDITVVVNWQQPNTPWITFKLTEQQLLLSELTYS